MIVLTSAIFVREELLHVAHDSQNFPCRISRGERFINLVLANEEKQSWKEEKVNYEMVLMVD